MTHITSCRTPVSRPASPHPPSQVPQLVETLTSLLDQLERCQKALSDFLEQKRKAFPRFYFIGDDDLLEILGQAKNPAVIQSHLKKLFAGIFSVKFSEGDASIIAMCSLEGEVVPLAEPVPVSDTVEVWLALLNTQMRATLVQLVDNTIGSRLNIAATPSQVRAILRRAIISAQFSAQFSGAIR